MPADRFSRRSCHSAIGYLGLGRQIRDAGGRLELHQVNGQPGALVREPTGKLISVFALDISDGAVRTIRSVINPDKLRHLGPVADVYGLLRQLRQSS